MRISSPARVLPSAAVVAALALLVAGCPGPASPKKGSGAPGSAESGNAKLSKHLEDARSLFEHAQSQPIDEQTRIYEQIVKDYSDSEVHEVALSRLALNYYVRGRLDEAEAACHTFLNLYPESPQFVFPLQFPLDRASLAVKEAGPADLEAAKAKLRDVLAEGLSYLEKRVANRTAKDDSIAWAYRVRLNSLSGDGAAVIRIATELIDAFPSIVGPEGQYTGVTEALETRADAFVARGGEGDRARAIADYEKLLAYLRASKVVDKSVKAAIERVEEKLRPLKK